MKNVILFGSTKARSLINFRGALIKKFSEMGFEVICTSIEPATDIEKEVNLLGAKYIQTPGTRTGLSVLSGLKMIKTYKKIFLNNKVNYCYLYMSKPVAFGGYAAIKAKVKNINILINGLETAYYKGGLKNKLIRIIMNMFYKVVSKKANNVFFQNSDDLSFFKNNHLLKYENYSLVNGSGVDMEYFSRKELPIEPAILMTARLLWSKGIREYLGAVAILREKYPYLKVMLLGGLDEENSEALSKDELDDVIKKYNIDYCGYSLDVRPFLEKCSIFVLPSYHEGLPRSVIEAMAVGRAIVTTNVPGCKETVIDGFNGYLAKKGDEKDLADKIDRILSDNKKIEMFAENSFKLCLNKYDVKKVNDIIIDKIIKGKS